MRGTKELLAELSKLGKNIRNGIDVGIEFDAIVESMNVLRDNTKTEAEKKIKELIEENKSTIPRASEKYEWVLCNEVIS